MHKVTSCTDLPVIVHHFFYSGPRPPCRPSALLFNYVKIEADSHFHALVSEYSLPLDFPFPYDLYFFLFSLTTFSPSRLSYTRILSLMRYFSPTDFFSRDFTVEGQSCWSKRSRVCIHILWFRDGLFSALYLPLSYAPFGCPLLLALAALFWKAFKLGKVFLV